MSKLCCDFQIPAPTIVGVVKTQTVLKCITYIHTDGQKRAKHDAPPDFVARVGSWGVKKK